MIIDRTIGRVFSRLIVNRCLVICHGLPYERGSVVDKSYSDLAEFFSNTIPSLIFDFTGTGKSFGNFSLLSWVEDLVSIASQFNSVQILGFSMGGVVAIRASAELKNVERVAVVSSPYELFMDEDQLRGIYENAKSKGVLKGIGDFESFKSKFVEEFKEVEPKKWIKDVKCPILVVHGTSDEVVPFSHGIKIFESANEPKTFIRVEDGSHFLRRDERVIRVIADWFAGKIKEKELTI